MNGRGIPTMGISPVTMDILIIVDNIIGTINPKARSIVIKFFIVNATNKSLKNNKIYKINNIVAPKNPHSSHKTEKIKSVLLSGKNLSLFCVPFKNPLPNKPPDPIAIIDCSI